MNYTKEMTKEEILKKVYDIEHQLLSMAGELDKIYKNLYYSKQPDAEEKLNLLKHEQQTHFDI